MMESVFIPLVKAVQCGEIETATLNLGAELHERVQDRLRLTFGQLEIRHQKVYQREHISELVRRLEYVMTKRIEQILYAILMVLIITLLILWNR